MLHQALREGKVAVAHHQQAMAGVVAQRVAIAQRRSVILLDATPEEGTDVAKRHRLRDASLPPAKRRVRRAASCIFFLLQRWKEI